MTQKNTLLVVGLITLFTASINAAELEINQEKGLTEEVFALKEREKKLTEKNQEIAKLLEKQNPTALDYAAIGRHRRELNKLQEEATALKAKLTQ